MTILSKISDTLKGKVPLMTNRSPKWPAARKNFLKDHPVCEVCGSSSKLEVHHIKPFHLHPELELDPTNFVTLCESSSNGVNCHLWFGHLGNFKSFNVDVLANAAEWLHKFKNRPLESKE